MLLLSLASGVITPSAYAAAAGNGTGYGAAGFIVAASAAGQTSQSCVSRTGETVFIIAFDSVRCDAVTGRCKLQTCIGDYIPPVKNDTGPGIERHLLGILAKAHWIDVNLVRIPPPPKFSLT